MAHVLDLVVLPAGELQLAPLVQLAQVAGAVDQLGVEAVQGVLDEGLGGDLGVVVVAQGQAGAADADLALLTGSGQLVFFVEQQDLGVAEGTADGQRLVQTELTVHLVIAADAGGLGGAVEVDEAGIGQRGLPQIELLDGENLTGEGHGVQMLGLHLLEGPEGGDHGQCGNDPADGVDVVLVQKLHQLDGEHEQLLGDQNGGGTVLQGGHDLLEVGVEVQGSLVAEDAVFVELQHIAEVLHIIQHAPVAGGDALGHAGGAGGEDDVDGIGVDLLVPDGGQSLLVDRGGADLIVDVGAALIGELLDQLLGVLITDHGLGLQGPQDQIDPVGGHLIVQGDVVAAGIDGAEEGSQGGGMLLHEHHHGLAVESLAVEEGAHGTGLIIDLAEGQAVGVIGESHFVGHPGNGVLQIFQNIGLHQMDLLILKSDLDILPLIYRRSGPRRSAPGLP